MSLPSREEYLKILADTEVITMREWNVALYKCPRCNGEVKRDYSQKYEGDPPKYRYHCRDCMFEEVL